MLPDAETSRRWTFEDVCLWTCCPLDELWQRIAPLCRRPGPAPACSDAELVTMALVGECRGWDQETDLIAHWRRHRDPFPRLPERSRFNRRRRQLAGSINALRRALLATLDLAQDRHCVLDSLPVPVIRFHLVPASNRAEWQTHAARFGKVPSKRVTIFGYKLYLLVTLSGVILDFVPAPANVPELRAGAELLAEHADLEVPGDEAFVSAPVAETLWAENRVRLVTLPRPNERQQVPAAVRERLNGARQVAETVNSQLAEQFRIELNHAQGFWGLRARLVTTPTAHVLCVHLDRLLGHPRPLQIKHLAFPISHTGLLGQCARWGGDRVGWCGDPPGGRVEPEAPAMAAPQKAPLRPLAGHERRVRTEIARAPGERADRVARAKALLAVADGATFAAAARAAGRRSGDAVARLVARFAAEGMTALDPRHGGGPAVRYGAAETERIPREARRTPGREQDGTATWSSTTLQRALRAAPDGLPAVSTFTNPHVLHDAGLG